MKQQFIINRREIKSSCQIHFKSLIKDARTLMLELGDINLAILTSFHVSSLSLEWVGCLGDMGG